MEEEREAPALGRVGGLGVELREGVGEVGAGGGDALGRVSFGTSGGERDRVEERYGEELTCLPKSGISGI